MKNKIDKMLEVLQNPNAMIAIGVSRFYGIAFSEIKYNVNEEVIELHIDKQDNYIKVNLSNAWICGLGSQLKENAIFHNDGSYIEVGKDFKTPMKKEYHKELLRYIERNFSDIYYKLDSDLINPEEYSLTDNRIVLGLTDTEMFFPFVHETNKSYNFELCLKDGRIDILNYTQEFLPKILRYFNIHRSNSKVNRITLIGLFRLLKVIIKRAEMEKMEQVVDTVMKCLHKKY